MWCIRHIAGRFCLSLLRTGPPSVQRALWLPPDTSGSRCPIFNPRPDLCLKGLRSQAAPSAKFLWTWCPRFRASAISPIAFSNAADAETSRSCRRRLTITLFRSEQNGTAVTLRPLQAAFYHRPVTASIGDRESACSPRIYHWRRWPFPGSDSIQLHRRPRGD